MSKEVVDKMTFVDVITTHTHTHTHWSFSLWLVLVQVLREEDAKTR